MKTLLRSVAVAFSIITAAACSSGGGGGGGGSGSGSITGTIAGNSMTVRSAVTAPAQLSANQVIQFIVLSDASNACATLSAGNQPANAQAAIFQIANINLGNGSASAPTAPGTFTIFDPSMPPTDPAAAAFSYQQVDGTCNVTAVASATAGTVTLTSVAAGNFSGTASFTTDFGEPVTASFAAASCPALGPLLIAPNPPPCN